MSSEENQIYSKFTQHSLPRKDVLVEKNSSTAQLDLSVHKSLSQLEVDWLEFEKKSHCSPFQRFSWIKALYHEADDETSEHKQPVKEPFLISGHIDNKLVLILPMMIETSLFGKNLKWVGSEVSDYNGIILDADYASKMPIDMFELIIGKIQKSIPDLDAIYLKRNFASQDVIKANSISSWQAEYGSHTLKLSQDWTSLYARIRSKKSRQRLGGKLRAFKKSGKITFKQVRNRDESLEVTQQILEWKSNQLTLRGSRNPFGSKAVPSQTRDVIMASAQDLSNTSIKAFGMYRNNELVAGMLAFINDGKFFYLVSAYSPEVPHKFSIGTQLLVKTIELASRSKLSQYDFLLGDEPYKFDWCDTQVKLVNHMIPLTFKGRLFEAGIRTRYYVKKFIVQSPLLSDFGRQLLKTSRSGVFSPSIQPSTAKSKTSKQFANLQLANKNAKQFENKSLPSEGT